MEATKARARLIVYWPRTDAMIEQFCRVCNQCDKELPSHPGEPMIHLAIPEVAFQFVSADFADCDGRTFLMECSETGKAPNMQLCDNL